MAKHKNKSADGFTGTRILLQQSQWPFGIACWYGLRRISGKNEENYLNGIRNYKPVICITGDGDAIFGNFTSALWSVKHYNLGVVYIILNNGSWAVEWPYFENTIERIVAEKHDHQFIDLDSPRISYSKWLRHLAFHHMMLEHSKSLILHLKMPLMVQEGVSLQL
ncbi:thiamine pyrophosphate-dependent enzyme [Acidiplasma cupricumulans]|uniref:thiamine pyrophosphate-dependent enzyme n=1 Tax=Acidiplasma cupricumulans TaxID=312540 RepID=UPI001585713F|nr:thiamine pyrophosphate-dependent enzyme [Acidiplasma cupricumulans]